MGVSKNMSDCAKPAKSSLCADSQNPEEELGDASIMKKERWANDSIRRITLLGFHAGI